MRSAFGSRLHGSIRCPSPTTMYTRARCRCNRLLLACDAPDVVQFLEEGSGAIGCPSRGSVVVWSSPREFKLGRLIVDFCFFRGGKLTDLDNDGKLQFNFPNEVKFSLTTISLARQEPPTLIEARPADRLPALLPVL